MRYLIAFVCFCVFFVGCTFVKFNLDGSNKTTPYERKVL